MYRKPFTTQAERIRPRLEGGCSQSLDLQRDALQASTPSTSTTTVRPAFATTAQAAMAHRDTSVSALYRELGIKPVTLYQYVRPQRELYVQGEKVLAP